MSQVFSVVVSLGFSEVPNLFRSHLEIFEKIWKRYLNGMKCKSRILFSRGGEEIWLKDANCTLSVELDLQVRMGSLNDMQEAPGDTCK